MNILIINSAALRDGVPGSSRHADFARVWIESGHRVRIVHSPHPYMGVSSAVAEVDRSGRSGLADGARNVIEYEEISIPRLGLSFGGRIASWLIFGFRTVSLAWGSRLRFDGARPDVVIGSSPDLVAAVAASVVARVVQSPFVLEVRDLWPLSLIHIGGFSASHPGIRVLGMLERLVYQRAAEIVMLLGRGHARVAEVLGNDSKRVTHIPNGVPSREVSSQSSCHRSSLPMTIVYAGAIGRANKLEIVIEAAIEIEKRVDSAIQWIIYGDGVKRSALEAMAEENGVRSVDFRDPVPKREIREILADADVLFIGIPESPLYDFGVSPNKVYDYLAAGRPLFAAGVDPEGIVAATGCGVTTRFEANDIADAASWLLNQDSCLLHEMGQRGREFVIRNHDVDSLATAYLQVVARVAAGADPDPGRPIRRRVMRLAMRQLSRFS